MEPKNIDPEINKLEREVKDSNAKTKLLEEQIRSNQQDKNRMIDRFILKIKNLEDQLKKERESLNQSQKQLLAANKRSDGLQKAYNMQKERISQLKKQNQDLQTDSTFYKARIADLEHKIHETPEGDLRQLQRKDPEIESSLRK